MTRSRYNFFETLVAGIYAVGTIIVLQFVFALIALLYSLVSGLPLDLRYSDLLKLGYFIWFSSSLLRMFDYRYKMLRGVLFVLLAAGTFTAWRIWGVPELARLFME